MATTSIYKTPEGRAEILKLYDDSLNQLGLSFDDRLVNTRFGATHVLMSGPTWGLPLVITHGGNSINPQGLRELLPLLRSNRYRIYAPDTIGHPGKSAEVRLSSNNLSYGQWLYDVLTELGLGRATFVGGSFGAGIILRLAAYAPERIMKAALFVPAGIVKVPWLSMIRKIGIPYLLYLLSPTQTRLKQAVQWMGSEIDSNTLQLIESVFQHVRVEANMPRPATREELRHFKAPALVIAGEKDAMFPGRAVAQRAKEIIPNLSFVECLKDGTHYSSKAHMAYINRRLIEFIESTP
ncbi:MAG TPA: alpha/beta hydrolase [Anaerolineales bacterium]|nr:alpha/beta hydrolase [Anaerolineales bacterium]